jgi:hypothetical protein
MDGTPVVCHSVLIADGWRLIDFNGATMAIHTSGLPTAVSFTCDI